MSAIDEQWGNGGPADHSTYLPHDDEPVTTEREFLGLDDVIAKATERTKAAEIAADMLVTLYRTGITPHPDKFAELRAAVEGWEANR